MKDAIDKRDEREKIAKSIVKRWNVVYTSKEELEQKRLEEERQEKIKEERQKADEILKRLEAEAREDERRKNEEIEAILRQKQVEDHKSNDTYGTAPMDGVTQEKVEAILNDKERMLQKLIQNTEMDSEVPELEEGAGPEPEADNAPAEAADGAEIEEDKGAAGEEAAP